MGRWIDTDTGWAYDPSGDENGTRTFVGDDGETYERISAREIEPCDQVDSTSIVDFGAPA